MFLFASKSPPAAGRKPSRPAGAFTLVEIVLAIGLATALLLIALTFYHQTTEMRGRILREAEQFSTLRLVLDHLAGDLRAAQSKASPGNEFVGDATSLRFIKQALIVPPPNPRPGTVEASDLVRITLTTVMGTNGTNVAVSALNRLEEPLNQTVLPASPATNLTDLVLLPADQTNQVTEPFTDLVRFVRFRYWDGVAWLGGWTNASPPTGVEIILAAAAPAEDAGPDDYPPEAFRRVVFVPGGVTLPGVDDESSPNLATR